MQLAIVAHDKKKELMTEFCIAYLGVLSRHDICATGTTGRYVSEATGLKIESMLSGAHGGLQQITARVAFEEIDAALFFRDTSSESTFNEIENEFIRMCDLHNIPIATNIATAELLIHGIERGDLDWRELINPNSIYNLHDPS